MRRRPDYKWLEHTADIRVRIFGVSEAALYESAVLTLTAIIAEPPKDHEEEVTITVRGPTPGDRLMALFRELLFVFDVDGTLVVAAEVACEDDGLTLRGRAVSFDPERHVGLREVKAVTYHQLEVEEDEAGWSAVVVFDV